MSMFGKKVKADESRGMRRGGRVRVGFNCGTQSRAKQEFRDECDINVLMKKYERTGLITHVNRYQGQYADVTEIVDYQGAQNAVIAAQEAFGSLPSSIRARFENDPAKFMDFVHDEANFDKLVEMGLAKARPKGPEPVQDAPKAPAAPVPG